MADSLLSSVQAYDRLRAYLTGITVESATGLVRLGSTSPRYQSQLFDTIIARDATVGSAVDRRIGNLLSASWEWRALEGVNERKAQRIIEALPEHPDELVEHLGRFALYGYAAAEINWQPDGVATEVTPFPFNAIDATSRTDLPNFPVELHVYQGGRLVPIEGDVAERLIVLRADPHDPGGAALLRRVVGPWLITVFLLRDWAKYAERFGTPIVKGEYDPAAREENGKSPQQIVLDALEALHANSRLAVPRGFVAELMADSRADASAAFDRLFDRCDRQKLRGILGQDSTTTASAVSGARASDEIRSETEDAIAERDARHVKRALDRQLVRRVEKYRAGGERLIEMVYSWDEEQPPLERAQTLVALSTAGAKFVWHDELEKFGLEEDPAAIARAEASAQALADLAGRQTSSGQGNAGTAGAQDVGAQQPPDETTGQQSLAVRVLSVLRSLFGRKPSQVEPYRASVTAAHDALDSIAAHSSQPLNAAVTDGLMRSLRDRLHEGLTVEQVQGILRASITADHVHNVAEVFEAAINGAALNGVLMAAAQMERLKARKKASGA